ncbi:MAG: hypothetical protein ACTSRL_22575 [Candidatus Helarchaeota archaeon]
MKLSIQEKIEIILSLNKNILLPVNYYFRNRIFYELYKRHEDFFNELNFKQKNGSYFQSDELYYIFFEMRLSHLLKPINNRINKYYQIPKTFRKQIINRYKSKIENQKALFENIKKEYIKILNDELPDSKL